MADLKWNSPSLYGVGHFTDFQLYEEALNIAKAKKEISPDTLMRELPYRVKGLMLIEGISNTTINDLLRELIRYNFIQKSDSEKQRYRLTEEGVDYLELLYIDKAKAKDILLDKMQQIFVTPAWLLERMWSLNPKGQGEIVIPLPVRSWRPTSKAWTDCLWTSELDEVCKATYDTVQANLPYSFPLDKITWVKSVRNEYERLGQQQPRSRKVAGRTDAIFAPRARLSLAMKTISVHMLFGRKHPLTGHLDHPNKRSEMTHRSFMVWCPRLENLDLLFYTDYNPLVPGRIMFPLSSFKHKGSYENFIAKDFIKLSDGRELYVHQPQTERFYELFQKVLIETYQRYFNLQSIMYVSIQDIRDEMCRLLRISPTKFEIYLQKTYDQSVKREFQFYISLETDLREDMKVQLNRRGVFINGRMYSLIAIKPF